MRDAANDMQNRRHISPIEDIIDCARNGRMFILVDDEDRENEGDLIVPAQMVTPEAINFMATHGRGLICLALARERVEALGLPAMTSTNGTAHQTAFTVSIEAKTGVTTGISAADRARTVMAAINAASGADDLVSPGHIFPLCAQPGGVLVRAGHTEAAVDIARLAGLNPSGVICEIMNDDGTMARLDHLIAFAQRHSLKIGTIGDLIAYRRRHDHLVESFAERRVDLPHGGDWRAVYYRNRIDGLHHVALVKGRIEADEPTLVRMHSISLLDDVLGAPGKRSGLLHRSMGMIDEHGSGVVVLLRAETDRLLDPGEDHASPHADMDMRAYGVGAQILAHLEIHSIVLLTSAQINLVAAVGWGISIVEQRRIDRDSSHSPATATGMREAAHA